MVEGLSWRPVSNAVEAREAVDQANVARIVAQTKMNAVSSRCASLFLCFPNRSQPGSTVYLMGVACDV